MTKFLLRRLVNYVILVFIATSLAYILAAVSLNPKSNYENRNPKPPEAVISAKLDSLNLNPDTPVFVRYGHWLDDLAHGNLGSEVQGELRQRRRRPAAVGQRPAAARRHDPRRHPRRRDRGVVGGTAVQVHRPLLHAVLVRDPVRAAFVLAILLQILATKINSWTGHTVLRVLRAVQPEDRRRQLGALLQPPEPPDPADGHARARRRGVPLALSAQRDAGRAGKRLRAHRPRQGTAHDAPRSSSTRCAPH